MTTRPLPLLLGALGVGLVCFVVFVWPTPYERFDYPGLGMQMRRVRLTNRMQILAKDDQGEYWRTKRQPLPKETLEMLRRRATPWQYSEPLSGTGIRWRDNRITYERQVYNDGNLGHSHPLGWSRWDKNDIYLVMAVVDRQERLKQSRGIATPLGKTSRP